MEEGERAAWVMRDLKGDEVEVGEDEAEGWYSWREDPEAMSRWDEEDARTVGGTGSDDMAEGYKVMRCCEDGIEELNP